MLENPQGTEAHRSERRPEQRRWRAALLPAVRASGRRKPESGRSSRPGRKQGRHRFPLAPRPRRQYWPLRGTLPCVGTDRPGRASSQRTASPVRETARQPGCARIRSPSRAPAALPQLSTSPRSAIRRWASAIRTLQTGPRHVRTTAIRRQCAELSNSSLEAAAVMRTRSHWSESRSAPRRASWSRIACGLPPDRA